MKKLLLGTALIGSISTHAFAARTLEGFRVLKLDEKSGVATLQRGGEVVTLHPCRSGELLGVPAANPDTASVLWFYLESGKELDYGCWTATYSAPSDPKFIECIGAMSASGDYRLLGSTEFHPDGSANLLAKGHGPAPVAATTQEQDSATSEVADLPLAARPPLPLALASVPQAPVAPALQKVGKVTDINALVPIYATLTTTLFPVDLPSQGDDVSTAMTSEIERCGISILGPSCEGGRFVPTSTPWVAQTSAADGTTYFTKAFTDSQTSATYLTVYIEPSGSAKPTQGYIYLAPDTKAGPSAVYGLFAAPTSPVPMISFGMTDGPQPAAAAK